MGELTRIIPRMGLKRAEASKIVLQLMKKYEDSLPAPDKGKRFDECYDVVTCTPTKEWLDIYEKGKRELTDLGINYNLLI